MGTIGLVVLKVLIWVFSDDDLQNWCEKSVFGKKPNNNMVTGKPEAQMNRFGDAILGVSPTPCSNGFCAAAIP